MGLEGQTYATPRHINQGAKIGGVLYQAGVSDPFLGPMTDALRSKSVGLVRAVSSLYARLMQHSGLEESDAARIFPHMVSKATAHLLYDHAHNEAPEGAVDRYVKEWVEWYLQQQTALKPGVVRDRHHGTGKMVYGKTEGGIPYRGVVDSNMLNGQMRHHNLKQVRKLRAVAALANAGQWDYAAEAHRDLVEDFLTPLFGRATTYKQFLVAVESIIMQRSGKHKIVIMYHPHGVPVGYSVVTPAQYLEFMGGLNSRTVAYDGVMRRTSHTGGTKIPKGRPVPRSQQLHFSTADLEGMVGNSSRSNYNPHRGRTQKSLLNKPRLVGSVH